MARDTQLLSNLIRHMALAEKDPLTPLIDEYLIKRGLSDDRLTEYVVPLIERGRPGGRLSPSAIGGCKRQAALKFLGVRGDRKVSLESELTFDDGNWGHHKWDARFLDMQAVLGPQRFKVVKIEGKVTLKSLYIAGSYDAVIKIGGKLYVVDFKTIHSHGFGYIYRENRPKDAHVKQIITYCVARNIRRGIILYDDKGISSNYLVFMIEFDDKDWIKVQHWCESVLRMIQKEKLPKKSGDCDHGNFLFEACPFARYCWSEREDRDERLRAKAFRNFTTLDEAWESGLQGWK